MNKIFINAGHSSEDSGAVHDHHTESEFAMKIRDFFIEALPNAIFVPDTLNLRESIAWVNERATEDDFAGSFHLNYHNNTSVRGVEVYYDVDASKAEIFAKHVSRELGIPNRGARHDSETYVGSLGWLRKLACDSVLIEVCYMSNPDDLKLIMFPSNQKKAAIGAVKALKEVKAVTLLQRIIFLLKELQAIHKKLKKGRKS